MKTIAVLGSNSGRNAGDAAILGNLLRDISALYPDVLFKVPTTHPGFVESWVETARPVIERVRPERVFFSFHGLPERP